MKKKPASQLRIIGGQWRGRKLDILDLPGLRPTPDRVRETLFNWLQPYIHGARCLDLFAGTGALGIEAVSRGAALATLVEADPRACRAIRQAATLLKTTAIQCQEDRVENYLGSTRDRHKPYHIVFLDPPYRKDLASATCRRLLEDDWLRPDALIYLETESDLQHLDLPTCLEVVKSKQAGQVAYCLLKKTGDAVL